MAIENKVMSRIQSTVLEALTMVREKEKERQKLLRLLYKAFALIVYADGEFSSKEFLRVNTHFRDKVADDEERNYFLSCIEQGVTEDDIKKEIEENKFTKEELDQVIELCISLASLDGINEQERVVIEKLRNIIWHR